MILDPATLDRLFRQAEAGRWQVPRDVFGDAIMTSVRRAFSDTEPSEHELDRYLAKLHLTDLALACACALGHEGAWDHFMREHRPVLYRAADAIDPSGAAREAADALYAELYGVRQDDSGERRSLFRYFHGRSSLPTWLRAVLAQRHVDVVRSRRRMEPLPAEEEAMSPASPVSPIEPLDPDRGQLVGAFHDALSTAIAELSVKDRLRLRSYYAVELTLAQIGRITGEHEATVSRHLARTRQELRQAVARHLREAAQLSSARIERAFELVLEDPGAMNLHDMLGQELGRKEGAADRSK